MRNWLARLALALALIVPAAPALAEDGYELWLRYRALAPAPRAELAPLAQAIVVDSADNDPRLKAASGELQRALSVMLGRPVPVVGARAARGGAIVLARAGSPLLVGDTAALSTLGEEGYAIRTVAIGGHRAIVVAANGDAGLLYGSFALLRHLQQGAPAGAIDIASAPKIKLRVLDHWDNLDRHVERGYAGQSIFDWWRLPGYVDPRLTDYARANASIGINGAVLNNVNAKADSLTDPYIAKAAAIADALRPWGVRVYLSARFSAPIEIGGLKTADPLDPAVIAFWRERTEAIYRAIPDFGGYLVKASSEGQPGPGDYHRSHADGANMLAALVAPHGGTVMWRAFVYTVGGQDRVRQAYDEFKPLDGKFAANVLLQVKNGPLDFQPREPFHPLFGAMPATNLMPEFQITKEYLGFATHLVYLGALFEEVLRTDTQSPGPGATVARVADGSLDHHALTGIAGVANIGTDRDWTGSIFNQANWYAYGRLAWDPEASSRAIAGEWARLTFGPQPAVVSLVVDMMMASREAVVDYMTPLGLAHQMGTSGHYGPAPWVDTLARPEWNPTYYARADARGIGYDRTASGSNALAQYSPGAARVLADDPHYLLWFHHVSWGDRLADGQTMWQSLVTHYDRGVEAVAAMQTQWAALAPHVDAERFAKTRAFLAIQHDEALWWRDASIAYWQSLNHQPLPAGASPPAHALEWYKALSFPYAPGN